VSVEPPAGVSAGVLVTVRTNARELVGCLAQSKLNSQDSGSVTDNQVPSKWTSTGACLNCHEQQMGAILC
jgi:hypothetical protein